MPGKLGLRSVSLNWFSSVFSLVLFEIFAWEDGLAAKQLGQYAADAPHVQRLRVSVM
jgi:hypothetical protein